MPHKNGKLFPTFSRQECNLHWVYICLWFSLSSVMFYMTLDLNIYPAASLSEKNRVTTWIRTKLPFKKWENASNLYRPSGENTGKGYSRFYILIWSPHHSLTSTPALSYECPLHWYVRRPIASWTLFSSKKLKIFPNKLWRLCQSEFVIAVKGINLLFVPIEIYESRWLYWNYELSLQTGPHVRVINDFVMVVHNLMLFFRLV